MNKKISLLIVSAGLLGWSMARQVSPACRLGATAGEFIAMHPSWIPLLKAWRLMDINQVLGQWV